MRVHTSACIGQHRCVRVTIEGVNPPGRTFCRADGSPMDNVHVGVQVRRDPSDLVPGDREQTWDLDIDVVRVDGALDFRGPAVQGRRGERFVYLTWGDVGPDGTFEMFRRAKLVLDRIEPSLVDAAARTGTLLARVELSDARGAPRCARVDPPAVVWSVPS
jgi:hypothetical protein